jgi:hypothetical protein
MFNCVLLSSFFCAASCQPVESLVPGQVGDRLYPPLDTFRWCGSRTVKFARTLISSPARTFSPASSIAARSPDIASPALAGPGPLGWSATEVYMTSHDQSMSGTYTFAREFCSSLTSTSIYSGWLAATFVNSSDAESSLCADRSSFLRDDHLELIPLHIQRRIIHPGDVAQIEGFRELFDYLDIRS